MEPVRSGGGGKSRNKVVVITGATAGVGRAAARAFAREGASVALLARDVDALESARAEVESVGGRALAFPVDVANADAVFAAARQCEEKLGPIDVWVNNAMATVFGTVDTLEPEEVRRVTEVTYLGYVHGSMAALRHMRSRDRGVIVQVGSSLAYRGIPVQAAYCGAKHAIRGFTDSLRAELLHANSGIRITAVHLPAINTPQFDWARSHQNKAPRPVAPVYPASAAAKAIVRAAHHPTREYWLGGPTPLMILANALAPGLMDRYLAASAVSGQQRDRETPADYRDNLFAPVPGVHRTDGSFSGEARSGAITFTETGSRFGALGAACLLAGLVGAAVGAGLKSRAR